MHLYGMTTWRAALSVAALAAFMAGCGGGGSGSSGGGIEPPPPPTGSAAGVFTDAPVNGLAYTASPSGVTGVTGDNDVDGGFRYEPGDTVTFTLGGLTLGSATATGVVTPADIADGNPTVAANLLVLLQSLDSDSAEGRIVINLPASTNLSALSLTQPTNDFIAAPTFTNAVQVAGGAVVSLEDARAHAIAQFWGQVAGTWINQEDGVTVIVRFDNQGNFLLADIGPPDGAGFPGVETGRYEWDPTTQRAVATIDLDTNGGWGVSSQPEDGVILRFDGTRLLETDEGEGETWPFNRLGVGPVGSVSGAWVVLADPEVIPSVTQGIVAVFSPDGRFLLLDPQGAPQCGTAGVESGTYSLSQGILSITNVFVDNNGCGGLNDPTQGGTGRSQLRNLSFSTDGRTLTADVFTQAGEADGVVTLVRVTP